MIGIYKITNLLNGKCYIGQSIDIEKRWVEHKSIYNHPRCSNYHIYKAFRKYGIENFSFSVIEECEQSLLNDREKFWIQHYNSFEHGYNMTIGGDGAELINRSDVYSLWDKGLTVADIAKQVDCSPVTVSNIIRCYDKYDKAESMRRGKLWHRKPVVQYGLDGVRICEFNSISSASDATGVSSDGISACCNKRLKSAGGYMWSFDAKDWVERYENTVHPHFSKRKSVLQYTKENKLVGKYENLSDAQRQTGVGRLTISRVCNGVQEYGGGFIWKFAS